MKLLDLFERAKRPLFLGSVTHDLKDLESKLWSKDLSVSEIIKILNTKLEKYLIRFQETYTNKTSEYSRVGLDGGEFSGSGWITINMTQDADEVLNDQTRVYYSEFVDLATALIGHEMKHRDQILKSLKNFDDIPDTEDSKKYLSDHREIEAYAMQAVLELLPQLGKKDILSKLSNKLEKLADWSEAVKWYTYTFDEGDPVLKKFVKKIYEILDDEEE